VNAATDSEGSAMTKTQMTLIPTPAWARKSDIWLRNIKLADYYAIQVRRSELLLVVHREVERYLNTSELVAESEEGFPNTYRMSGEYYICDESYGVQVNPVRFTISVMARCLERASSPSQIDRDYLGLEVLCECFPDGWRFVSEGDVNSSVI
jgi:hypothetical protein